MKLRVITILGMVYLIIAMGSFFFPEVRATCLSTVVKGDEGLPGSTILPDIPEYVDGQPIKYQIPILSKQNKEEEIEYPPNYLLIWTAKWCSKCSLMKTVGDKLEEEGFDVYYIDFDKNKAKAKEAMIGALPTAIIYTDSEDVRRIVGIKPKTKKIVEAEIREVLEKNGQEEEEKEEEESNDYDIY